MSFWGEKSEEKVRFVCVCKGRRKQLNSGGGETCMLHNVKRKGYHKNTSGETESVWRRGLKTGNGLLLYV